jgi:uncharacterized membrane protein YqjE
MSIQAQERTSMDEVTFMAADRIGASALPQAISHVLADLADLFGKELRLARAELSTNIAAKLHAGIWMSAAAVLGLIGLLALVEAAILFIASYYGIALHWASLIVAVALAVIAGLTMLRARSQAQEPVAPTRAVEQIKKDISVAKEQLT